MAHPVTPLNVRIRLRYNGNPDNGLPLGYCGYTAEFEGCPDGIVGCPLGRARTVENAIHDLLQRTNAESRLRLTVKDLSVGTTPPIPDAE